MKMHFFACFFFGESKTPPSGLSLGEFGNVHAYGGSGQRRDLHSGIGNLPIERTAKRVGSSVCDPTSGKGNRLGDPQGFHPAQHREHLNW